jgi:SNF2 family DNA or RNA helicase
MNELRDVASYGIMHSIDWVPNKMVQAEGRLHRMGQVGNVHWVYLAMKETMDAAVVRTVIMKMDYWRGVMGQDDGRSFRDDLDDQYNPDSDANRDVLRAIYEEL